jgi:hypothetical protein
MNKPHSILIYGDSGETKTTQCYFLAKYIYEKYGLRGRIIGSNASDNAPYEQSGLIEKGVVDYFDISNREMALADLRKLSEGYWARDTKAGGKGAKDYFQKNDKCLTTKEEWDKIGFYIIEGITGVSSLLMNHCRSQNEGVGFKHSYKYEEEGYVIGGLSEGHYSLVQQELYKIIVQGFACLPVKFIIWTALVGKGEDRTKETVYGPKGAGTANTYIIPSWFMDCWHLASERVMVKVNDNESREAEIKVAWFIRHPDKNTGIDYPAKVRVMPEILPEIFNKFEKGYVRLKYKEGLDVFYREMDNIVSSYNEGIKDKKNVVGQT